MKICPSCQSITTASDLCNKCGKPFLTGDDGMRPTQHMVSPFAATEVQVVAPRILLNDLFAGKQSLVIGRGADCDVRLPHPTISRYHAVLELQDGRISLRDLASVNGVWFCGQRISETVIVREGEQVGIGPYLFTLRGGTIHSVDSSKSMRLEALGLEKVVTLGRGQRKLLDDINLVVNPGEFVSLLGPSGSGKSTLMDCLNGRRRATGGRVLANGEDFYRHFHYFRQSLGYVPQKDIVHKQLSVYRALHYTALLRLPTDTAASELRSRIEDVLGEMELGLHRDTLVSNLSGGQIKRVSLGAELLAQPSMLYIDEATSGLDAGTEARMMRLFRRLADEGRSILCITHNVDNVDQCHLVLVLARGKLIYYGPPTEAPVYFGVSRVSEIYDQLGSKDELGWEKQFRSCSLYKEYIEKRLASTIRKPAASTPSPERLSRPPSSHERERTTAVSAPALKDLSPPGGPVNGPALADRFRTLTRGALRMREWLQPMQLALHQFLVLTARYIDLVVSDGRGLRLLLMQAPLVAFFILAGFYDKGYQATVPVPRPFTESERKVLHAIDALGGMVRTQDDPQPNETKALREMQIELPVGGTPTVVDGLQLLRILRAFHGMQTNAPGRSHLEAAQFTFIDQNGTTTVSMAELASFFDNLQATNLLGRLHDYRGPILPDGEIVNPRFTYLLMNIIVVAVLWFGCNNASKEIVKEEAIYGRERAVNLGIFPYLGSKFLVLSLITIFQAFLLMVLLYGPMHLLQWYNPERFSVPYSDPTSGYMVGYAAQFGVLSLLAMTAVALGLLLSACVTSPDRANALMPYVLIPQLILGGGLISVETGFLHQLAVVLSPLYWAYRGIRRGANNLPSFFPGHVDYPDNIWVPCQALAIQMVVALLLTAWYLRRKDA